MSLSLIRFIAGALLLVASVESAVAQRACADLMDLELPYTTITSAAMAAEGPIPQPAIFGNTAPHYGSRAMRSAGDHAPHEGFRDSNRDLAASLRMERKVSTNRQRRLGWFYQSNGADWPSSARLCRRRDRRRSCQRRLGTWCHLGYRPSGKTDRFRLSRRARNKRSGQSYPARLFWTRCRIGAISAAVLMADARLSWKRSAIRKTSRASSPERPRTTGRACSRGSSGMNERWRRIRFRLPS